MVLIQASFRLWSNLSSKKDLFLNLWRIPKICTTLGDAAKDDIVSGFSDYNPVSFWLFITQDRERSW